jgi:hypothetical protein
MLLSFPQLENENCQPLDIELSALYLLAAPSTSSELQSHFFARAKSGQRVRYKDVKASLQQAKVISRSEDLQFEPEVIAAESIVTPKLILECEADEDDSPPLRTVVIPVGFRFAANSVDFIVTEYYSVQTFARCKYRYKFIGSTFLGLPPGLAAGMNSLRKSHCSLVRSVRYDFLAALMIFCLRFTFRQILIILGAFLPPFQTPSEFSHSFRSLSNDVEQTHLTISRFSTPRIDLSFLSTSK